MPTRTPCLICEQVGKWRYSPDPDIHGLFACDDHREDVYLACRMLLNGKKEQYDKFVKELRDDHKK